MNSAMPPLLLEPLPLSLSLLPLEVASVVPLSDELASPPVETDPPSLPVSGGPDVGSVDADVPLLVGDVAVAPSVVGAVAEADIVAPVASPPVSPAPTVPSSLHATSITTTTHPRCKRTMRRDYQTR
jgi:hypothetical protein